jgi:hypothetical protein
VVVEKIGYLHKTVRFFVRAFSEKGEPSSARLLSGWLSVSSMALIWFIIRHAFYTDSPEKLITWIGGLPAIIYALAAFAISPFGLAKISSIWNKDKDKDADKADPTKG